ncbi:dienelactone hydrolase family protein [Rhodococcoides yunnanense]|uniref:Dienelactone hydrolase family protein n=1 Tax=Rhodococcoides yunnanense TaxID=278209 RepID=A0ABU4BIK8_9NOCA|nr:dienelactone hydrolase family protein [Rhodococcus yunnanensis]MDV6263921.1 dienelactone hydrolase family protein [Rhodococcus yunnanensis]
MPNKTLQIPTRDGYADAFAAFPDRLEASPGILMYPDAFGIRPVLREMAQKLADCGYFVLVPNIFYRHGPTPLIELPDYIGEENRPAIVEQLMPLINQHTTEQAYSDARANVEFLLRQSEVSRGPIGVIGYCLGGLLAARTAAAHPGVVAAIAAFHGPVEADGVSTLEKIKAKIHFGHAESDVDIDGLGRLNSRLDEAGLDYTSEIYPGTAHGFTMSDTDTFDLGGMQRHWDRLRSLLDSALPEA